MSWDMSAENKPEPLGDCCSILIKLFINKCVLHMSSQRTWTNFTFQPLKLTHRREHNDSFTYANLHNTN